MKCLVPDVMPACGLNGNSRAVVVSPDAAMAREAEALLVAEVAPGRVEVFCSYPDADGVGTLAGRADIGLCLVDAGTDVAAAVSLMRAFERHSPAAAIALLPGDNPDLILRCVRQGATRFLVRPFTADQLESVLLGGQGAPTAAPAGRLIAVVPGKASAGATTLACNLAFALARLQRGKVLLADLDAFTGTVPFTLKLKSTYSVADALNQAFAIDGDMWKALVVRAHGFDVLLSSDNPIDCAATASGAPAAPLLASARRNYGIVVADTGGAFGDWNLEIARSATDVLLVSAGETAALHATQRALASLIGAGIDAGRIRLVVNRWREKVGFSPDEIGQATGLPVSDRLPWDSETLTATLIEGKPAPPGSPYGRAVANLAANVIGAAPANARTRTGGFLARLLM